MNSSKFGETAAAWFYGFVILLIVISFFCQSSPAYAAEITYTGEKKQLQRTPSWFTEMYSLALFPGTEAALLSSGNKVTVNFNSRAEGVTDPKFIAGGLSKTKKVTGNSVVLLNGLSSKVFGGLSLSGTVADNTVTISGNFVVENGMTREGWFIKRDVCGGQSDSGKVTGNTVTISGGLVAGGSSVDGGRSGTGISVGNKVAISAGSVEGEVHGGKSADGDATDNVVIISGGAVDGHIFGCYSGGGSALRNAVTISGGSAGGAVFGGYCYRGSAIGNTVTISGGSVRGDVYGGYGQIPSTATGNTVTISGRPDLTKSQIFGGYVFGGYSADAFTGNTLNLKSSISVKTVGNFEYYNFYLPQNLTAGGVMLNATKPADLVTEPVDLKGTTVKIFLQGGTKLRQGDKIALIKSVAGIENAPKNKSCQAKSGGALYALSIYTDKNTLWAEVTNIGNAAK